MNSKKIIHIGDYDKFLVPFIHFSNKNFSQINNEFILKYNLNDKINSLPRNVKIFPRNVLSRLIFYFRILLKINSAKKVIFHGFFDPKTAFILIITPWNFHKCYWVLWGGDLYHFFENNNNFNSRLRKSLLKIAIKKIKYILTYIKGDYILAKKSLRVDSELIDCLMYPSNTFSKRLTAKSQSKNKLILVGNSADTSNQHIEILKVLKKKIKKEFTIVCPLSYGNLDYANKVISYGEKLFGEKFMYLKNFIPLEEYNEILGNVDIAIFGHNRQQAMGNIIFLLGNGKKVYIHQNISSWDFFKSLKINVFNINDLNDDLISEEDLKMNIDIVKKYFSINNLKKQWQLIYE